MEESDEDLDTSWIDTAEFEESYEKESMSEISMFFVYTDVNGVIENIVKEYIDIELEQIVDGAISKDQLLHIIQTKRQRQGIGKKYRFMDLLLFHVPLAPGELSVFVKGEDKPDYLKRLSIFDDVVIDPSIFIFHDLNGLFFVFKEIDQTVVKSILKNSADYGGRATKKCRLDPNEYIEKKRKSMKRMMQRAKMTRKNI
jgi:hypothetical protein